MSWLVYAGLVALRFSRGYRPLLQKKPIDFRNYHGEGLGPLPPPLGLRMFQSINLSRISKPRRENTSQRVCHNAKFHADCLGTRSKI